MFRDQYLSENPFRLLGVGSSIAQEKLRRKAEQASKSAEIGIKSSSVHDDQFGKGDIQGVSVLVRDLSNDPTRRTVYRIMWPLSESSLTNLNSLNVSTELSIPPEEILQLEFLLSWCCFIRQKGVTEASDCLEKWSSLYSNDAMDTRLQSLIQGEDDLSEDEALNTVFAAQDQLAQYILNKVISVSTEEWRNKNFNNATEIVRTVLNSPTDENMQDNALEPMIEIGERLSREIKDLIVELDQGRGGISSQIPSEVTELEILSETIAARHPVTGKWTDVTKKWRGIYTVLLNAAQKSEPSQKSSVHNYESPFQDSESQSDHYGLKKINKEPFLWTRNGFGISIYGNAPYIHDSNLQFSSTYFTVFGIPIFPISRYLAKKVDSRNWKFFARTRWTQGMKFHFFVSLIALSSLVLFGYLSLRTHEPATSTTGELTAPIVKSEEAPPLQLTPPEESPPSQAIPDSSLPTVSGRLPAKKNTSNDSMSTVSKRIEPSPKPVEEAPQLSMKGEIREELKMRLGVLKDQIATAQEKLGVEDKILDAESTEIEDSKKRLDDNPPNTASQREVDEYNEMVRAYESKRKEFNSKVEKFNEKRAENHVLITKYNLMADQLNKGIKNGE